MELRHYIEVLKRHRWLIVQGIVLVGLIAGLVSGMQTPVYQASARVLLRPGDASESLYPNGSFTVFNDPDRYVSSQEDIIQSEGVAKDAAKALGNANADVLLAHVAVAQAGTTDVLSISGSDIDPTRARDIANAFAKAYIENRRQYAVASLQKASDEIQGKLDQLQARIADLNTKIGDGGLNPQQLQGPTGSGVSNVAVPTIAGPTGTGLDDGTTTSVEGLKAARYAAAIQYENLYARQQEIQVDMSLKKGEAELIGEAKTPSAPVSPKPIKNGILGGFVGFLLAVGISFLHEQLDDRIRSREEAERATGLTVLAELPADGEADKHPEELVAVQRPRSPLAESVRGLRTSVEFLGIDEPVARLVVTSPGPGEGKSLVSANLAAAYAQAGHKVVLVSADLRRPRLEAMFGIEATAAGLTDIITRISQPAAAATSNGNGNGKGRVKVAAGGGGTVLDVATIDTSTLVTPALTRQRRQAINAALCTTNVPNLLVLPAGTPPPNPSELLGSRRVEQVLDDLNKVADVVIIDTPPVLAVTDAAVLAGKSDGVLLVTSLRQTHRGAAQRASETLESDHVRLLGVVLNRCETSSNYYGYGYNAYYGESAKADAKASRKARKAAAKAAKAGA